MTLCGGSPLIRAASARWAQDARTAPSPPRHLQRVTRPSKLFYEPIFLYWAARNPPFVSGKQMVCRKHGLLGLTETNFYELCKLATSPLLYQAEQKQLAAAELKPLKAHLWNITTNNTPPATQSPLKSHQGSVVILWESHVNFYMASQDHL